MPSHEKRGSFGKRGDQLLSGISEAVIGDQQFVGQFSLANEAVKQRREVLSSVVGTQHH